MWKFIWYLINKYGYYFFVEKTTIKAFQNIKQQNKNIWYLKQLWLFQQMLSALFSILPKTP